uniref:DUF4258 domain-containing protein n=1 Tax=Ascaris lumbricoides TaxID=6252 RepID=A0A0M3ITZ2_ASCLU
MDKALHHRLTKRELQRVFGVEHRKDVPEYALITAKRRKMDDDHLRVQFNAWNDTYQIELKPNRKLLSPHLVIFFFSYVFLIRQIIER